MAQRFFLHGPWPARQGRLVSFDQRRHRFRELLGLDCPKSARRQIASARHARKLGGQCDVGRLVPTHGMDLGLDQFILQLPVL